MDVVGRCFTVDHTGISAGIELDVLDGRRVVTVGSKYELVRVPGGHTERYGFKIVPQTLPLDASNSPGMALGARVARPRILCGAIVRQPDIGCCIKSSTDQRGGCIVKIDTAHTDPCEHGGFWNVKRGNLEVIKLGHGGLRTIYPHGLSEPIMDDRAMWNIGVLLMRPDDELRITFNAPGGTFVARLTCMQPGELDFSWISTTVDPNYQWSDLPAR